MSIMEAVKNEISRFWTLLMFCVNEPLTLLLIRSYDLEYLLRDNIAHKISELLHTLKVV
jgi:hypothetical protein